MDDTTNCGQCGEQVAYDDTKIVSVPVQREGRTYPGMATHTEKRICTTH